MANDRVPREVRRAGLAIRREPREVVRRPAPSPAYWVTLRTLRARRKAAWPPVRPGVLLLRAMSLG